VEILLNSCLLCFLVITVVAIVFTNDLFNVGILTSVYSFFMTLLLFVLDAVDVAMTEAAVGAGITTVLLLSTVYLVGNKEIKPLHKPFLPIFVSLIIVSTLIFGTSYLPEIGSLANVVHQHVAPRYLYESINETGVPNIVTAVLASYRGFDTLGETTVVFTAGVGVYAFLKK